MLFGEKYAPCVFHLVKFPPFLFTSLFLSERDGVAIYSAAVTVPQLHLSVHRSISCIQSIFTTCSKIELDIFNHPPQPFSTSAPFLTSTTLTKSIPSALIALIALRPGSDLHLNPHSRLIPNLTQ